MRLSGITSSSKCLWSKKTSLVPKLYDNGNLPCDAAAFLFQKWSRKSNRAIKFFWKMCVCQSWIRADHQISNRWRWSEATGRSGTYAICRQTDPWLGPINFYRSLSGFVKNMMPRLRLYTQANWRSGVRKLKCYEKRLEIILIENDTNRHTNINLKISTFAKLNSSKRSRSSRAVRLHLSKRPEDDAYSLPESFGCRSHWSQWLAQLVHHWIPFRNTKLS